MLKKILIVNEIMSGGTGVSLLNLLNNIDTDKYQVTVLTLTKYGELYNQIPKNIKHHYLFKPLKTRNKIINFIWRVLKVRIVRHLMPIILRVKRLDKYDSIIAWTQDLPTIALQNVKHINKTSWVHTDVESYYIGEKKEVEKRYRTYKNIICVGEDARRSFNQKYKKLSNKTKVIYNIVDIKKIKELSIETVESLNLFEENSINIVSVGRLEDEKRFDILISASRKILDAGYKINTIIVGDGSLKEDLTQQIKDKKLEKNVKLLGYQNNPYKYMNLADILVICSDFEGFGLVAVEAMALQTAIVSTRVSGPKEIIGDNECGILVDCNNDIQLANAIITLIKDSNLRYELAEKALQKAEIFKSKHIIPEIYQLFE